MHVHVYERFWMRLMAVALAAFFAAVLYAAYGMGIHLPDAHAEHARPAWGPVDPDWPGVTRVAPGRYEVRLLALSWGFMPHEIRVPAGSEVTFLVRSQDVTHGLFIQGTTVNAMVIPGEVTRATYRFAKPGVYPFWCHEYCGIGHHVMSGRIVVTEAEAGQR